MVNFENATIKFHTDGSMEQVDKSTSNNVYTNVPVTLGFEPAEDDVLKLRRAFATTFCLFRLVAWKMRCAKSTTPANDLYISRE